MGHREDWLNGWERFDTVAAGRCVGCGADLGSASYVVDPDWTPPERDPDWPFDEATCPVHLQKYRIWELEWELREAHSEIEEQRRWRLNPSRLP